MQLEFHNVLRWKNGVSSCVARAFHILHTKYMRDRGLNMKRKHRSLPLQEPVLCAEKQKIEIILQGQQRYITIDHVKKILQYSTEVMIFSLGTECLEIQGVNLDCATYVSGAIGITGEIICIRFTKGVA